MKFLKNFEFFCVFISIILCAKKSFAQDVNIRVRQGTLMGVSRFIVKIVVLNFFFRIFTKTFTFLQSWKNQSENSVLNFCTKF